MGGKKIRHKPSHLDLLQTGEAESPFCPPGPSPASKLNALIVPASRRASSFDDLIKLSARLGATLVVLCSRLTKLYHVADRVARSPGARALIIDVPKGYQIPGMPSRTSRPEFRRASGGRASDLSTKRNLGLLLARLNGWNKVVFVDDDITLTEIEGFERLARRLERNQIAGMVCRDYPDNSVVCHARRLAGLPQDNFVSGSVLGVNCGDVPFPFFPDIYNEDWFFFSRAVAQYELSSVGDATQRPYKPYADPNRARQEEFGDLLAEGLFSLIGEVDDPSLSYREVLGLASRDFWHHFIGVRGTELQKIKRLLIEPSRIDAEARQAIRSLLAAEQQLNTIDPGLCTDFLDAWQEDLKAWEMACERTSNVGSIWEAMNDLGLRDWRRAEYGDAEVDTRRRITSRPVQVNCSA